MDIINGPTTQLVASDLIYQITLASGMIITNPLAFGNGGRVGLAPSAIVSEAGEILSGVIIIDVDWQRRQLEAIADLNDGRYSVYENGQDLLAAMDEKIARNEVRHR